jgi:D-3-phosphoglycerate dehydrogenase
MFKIQTFNKISEQGLGRFPHQEYEVGTELSADADAILLRSHKLDTSHVTPKLRAVARAGAGVNNIPVEDYTKAGIVVFNTPGANANAVKELLLCGLLLSARGVLPGIDWVKGLQQENLPSPI